ncbi:MAG: hypothetical protein GXX96_04295 [Planctomycetaceae bacterium]|nr:hypothetical protein [Planctomycetaceae bacterium]
MAHKKVPRNAPCPCGSGTKYKHCCLNKGFEWLVDDDGNILKSMPVSDDVAQVVDEQRQKFIEKHGRDFGPNDKLFFDMPPLEHVEHEIVQAMKQAGLDPAMIYAFEKTGLLVTEENEHLLSEADLAEWEAAIDEYAAQLENRELPDDEENEWF